MALDLENDPVFSIAIDGLPRIVKLIAAVPEEKRSLARAAAQQSYLKTAQALGYGESDAQQWASALMSILEIAVLANERATQPSLFQHEPTALGSVDEAPQRDTTPSATALAASQS
jgi:hypothetical protein